MKRLYIYLSLFLLLIIPNFASAQRTMRGQDFVSANLLQDFTSARSFGGAVSYGRYLYSSYWKSNIGIDNRVAGLSNGMDMDYSQIHAGVDWMYRCCSTFSRSVSLYAGAGVFLGYEAYDMTDRIPANINTGLGKGSFLYGARANLELEAFVATQWALLVSCSLPIHPGCPVRWFSWSAGVGVRYNL